jgi:chromosome segregation ATPase
MKIEGMRALNEELDGGESGEEQESHSTTSSRNTISSPLSLPASIDDDHHFLPRPPHTTDNERNDNHHDERDNDNRAVEFEAQVAALQAHQRDGESDRARLEEQMLRFQLQQHQQEHQQKKEQSNAQDLAEIRKQLQESQRRVVGLSDQLDFHMQENERLAKETGTLRAEAQATAKELQEAQTKIQRQAGKERIHDDIVARLDAVEKANADLQAQSIQQTAALAQATAAHDAMQRRIAEAAHCQDMLVLDKSFLSKELESLKAEHSATLYALQHSEEKRHNLSLASEEWSQQLQKVKEEAQRAYQLRWDQERCRLTAEQVGNRTTSQEAWEREMTMLREARQEALRQADRSRQELQALQQAHEDLVLRLAKQETTAQATMATLRAEVKYKAYELARVEAVLEEKCQALTSAHETLATTQAQCQDRRDACVRLEARTAQKEHELALALEKVQSYEVLETQLDAAVTSIRTRGREGGREGKPWVGSVPRRMQHAILLATRLRDQTEELGVVRREQQRAQEEAEGLRRQVRELQQLLHHSSQPGQYVVELLREKDRDVEGVRQQWQLMKTRVDEAQAQVQQLQREREREMGRERMQRQWQRREGGWGDRDGTEEDEEGRRRLNHRLAKHLLLMTRPPCGSGKGPRWHMKRSGKEEEMGDRRK